MNIFFNGTKEHERTGLFCLTFLIRGFFILICLAIVAPMAVAKVDPEKKAKWELRRIDRLKDYKDEKGKVRPDLWKKGVEHYKEMQFAAGVERIDEEESSSATTVRAAATPLSGVQWIQVGPQPAFPIESIIFQGNGAMSGEVLDMAIDPRGPSDTVIYSVSNDGGVWRSTDGGVTFEQKTDHMPSLSMGALALDPGNPSIVYAGTGNLYDGNNSTTTLAVKAIGIYRSTDMGESWSILNPGGIFTGRGIDRMAMPAAGVLLVGASNGLYKSVNGGMTFGTPPTYDDGNPIVAGRITDIDLDVNDPNTVYLSANGNGILVSTDAGDTFPTNLFTNPGAPASPGYIRMAQSASTPVNLYATVNGAGANRGVYTSTDSGDNWTRQAGADAAFADNNGCQCGYDQTIGVDPQDATRVYIGFQELYLSTDGGVNFAGVPISRNKIHWDHHYIGFSPASHWGGGAPTPMWVGTDGGIHSSSNGGTTFNNFHNSAIATNLFHNIDIGRGSAANNQWTYGGTQDTGTLHSCAPGGSCGAPANASGDIPWEMGNNGDGSGVAVDPVNPLRAYGVRNGNYRFTNDGGQNWANPNPNNTPVPSSAWRYAIDANDTTRVYMVTGTTFNPGTGVWRSNDNTGLNWSSIGNLTAAGYAIANTATDSDIVWFGLTNGRVQSITDATAANPTINGSINIPGNPGASVSAIAINPLNSDEMVVTYRGLCGGACSNTDNRMKRIFRTTDAGTTWADISGTDGNPEGNLPNLPTHSVVYDTGTSPPTIVVANDTGVLRSANNGATWEKLGLGLPIADSKMLQIDHSANPPLLRLGTYGRSVWELAEAQGPILAVNTDLGFDTVCIGERQTRIVQLFNVGSEDLLVNSIFRAEGSTQFKVLSGPSTPFTIRAGEEVDFTIEFAASESGIHSAIFQINSNDQFEPSYQITASGTVNTQMITTVIADSGSFGEVCKLNDFHDMSLTIANPGCGLLEVSDITIDGADPADFDLAGVMNFPLQIEEGNSIEIPIRFDPGNATICGEARSATLHVLSDDPANADKSVSVSGTVPCPDLNVAIANSGDFGAVCPGSQADLNLTLFNQGRCDLEISSISVDDTSNFVLPADTQFPLILSHDADFNYPVRFEPDPAQLCDDTTPRNGTVTINSDSPGEETLDVNVSGLVPCPNLVIDPTALTGLHAFPPTVVDVDGKLGCFSDQPVTIRNIGGCPLVITEISATGDDYLVIAPENFPIELPPGEETLEATVRFIPQADADPLLPSEVLGELAITSNDPDAGGTAELCGESVAQSGARLLVVDVSSGSPVPVDGVDSLTLKSKGKNTPSPVSITLNDAPVENANVCTNPIMYHLNVETLPSTGTTGNNPKASYEVSAKEGNLQSKTSFNLGQCEFREETLQLTSEGGKGGNGKGNGKP